VARRALQGKAISKPFGLSLSKPSFSFDSKEVRREGFDKLSPNGAGE
jgi:hypothetical protein